MTPLLIIIAIIIVFLVWRLNNHKPKTNSYSQEDFFNKQLREAKNIGVPKIPIPLQSQLANIIPSRDSQMEYFPCRVVLNSGAVFDNVYIADITKYLKVRGILPSLDSDKKSISINDIAKIDESPNRLPARFANKLYKAGESGMGYSIFTIVFKDGNQMPIVTGNAVDFVNLPNGYTNNDIVDVIPHEGRNANPKHGPEYIWCLYEP